MSTNIQFSLRPYDSMYPEEWVTNVEDKKYIFSYQYKKHIYILTKVQLEDWKALNILTSASYLLTNSLCDDIKAEFQLFTMMIETQSWLAKINYANISICDDIIGYTKNIIFNFHRVNGLANLKLKELPTYDIVLYKAEQSLMYLIFFNK